MKRYLLVLGVFVLACAFTGCGKKAPAQEETEAAEVLQETDVINEVQEELIVETEALDNSEIMLIEEELETEEDNSVIIETEE